MSEQTLWVEGICCERYRTRVRQAVSAVPGVERSLIDLGRNEVTVWGDAERKALTEAIRAVGFTVSPFPVPEPRGIG